MRQRNWIERLITVFGTAILTWIFMAGSVYADIQNVKAASQSHDKSILTLQADVASLNTLKTEISNLSRAIVGLQGDIEKFRADLYVPRASK